MTTTTAQITEGSQASTKDELAALPASSVILMATGHAAQRRGRSWGVIGSSYRMSHTKALAAGPATVLHVATGTEQEG